MDLTKSNTFNQKQFNSDFEKYLDFYIKETNRINEELEKLN